MSEWVYIGVAYGLTWTTLAGYAAYLMRRRSRAIDEWRRSEPRK